MKIKKRYTALLLTVLMTLSAVTMLTGCTAEKSNETPETTQTATEAATQVQDSAVKAEKRKIIIDTDTAGDDAVYPNFSNI
ncbi:MAG: hypothetical protein IJ168_07700 [Eubacterium sp.]|nr:hypothetical protein [Eubacterium sp.]